MKKILISVLLTWSLTVFAAEIDEANLSFERPSASSADASIETSIILRKLEQIQESISQLQEKVDGVEKRVNAKRSDPQGEPSASPSLSTSMFQSGGAVPAQHQVSLNDAEAYQEAFGLVQRKEFKTANFKFQSFVQTHPKSKYLPNAYYWLGELNLLESDYKQALAYFDKVIQEFPDSTKVPGCMLKKGYVYLKQGDTSEATKAFSTIIEKFPGTAVSSLAKDSLETIQIGEKESQEA